LEPGLLVKIVSLVDIIMTELLSSRERRLLLCTSGSRRVRLFESHPLWEDVARYVVLPGPADQRRVHRMIYELKSNRRSAAHTRLLEEFLTKYGVQGFVVGCTELHLIAKEPSRFSWLDPLGSLASEMAVAATSRRCPTATQS
jgi:aspartate racemase